MDNELLDDNFRVQAAAMAVTKNLEVGFGHSEEEARSLFAAFHSYYSGNGGWAPADYYDHETPASIALEIEFHFQFPDFPRRGSEFLTWRKDKWLRVSNAHWGKLLRERPPDI